MGGNSLIVIILRHKSYNYAHIKFVQNCL